MEREFKPFPLDGDPDRDVIVIGSGISGLTVGGILSRLGRKVTILEQHYVPGGCTHVFGKPGYEWNTGLHYLGDVHMPGHPLGEIFRFLTDGELHWSHPPEVHDRLIFPEFSLDLRAGVEAYREELLRYFPGEARGLERYFELLLEVKAFTRNFSATRVFPKLKPFVPRRDFERFFERTTDSVLREIFSDPRIIAVLSGQYGNYGLTPDRSAFGVHALVAWHYLHGSSFPVGGAGEIARTLARSIRRRGGDIFVRSEVDEILTDNGKASGVRLTRGGKVLRARTVISTAGVAVTMKRLLKKNAPQREKGFGHVSLALGIDYPLEKFNHDGANLWIHPSLDLTANLSRALQGPDSPPALSYVSFPCLKDPTWESRVGPGLSIDILGLAPLEWFSPWKDSRHGRRPEDYEDLKKRLAEPYLKDFFSRFPELSGKISHLDVSTPLTTRHYLGNDLGEVYGPAAGVGRYSWDDPGPYSGIKNLYLAGQDTLFHGIYGALVSGVLCAGAVHPLGTIREVFPTGILEV